MFLVLTAHSSPPPSLRTSVLRVQGTASRAPKIADPVSPAHEKKGGVATPVASETASNSEVGPPLVGT